MFCVISGKKKKSHPEIISSAMGMIPKNTPYLLGIVQIEVGPLPKLILALFEKVVHIIM